jgi:hypothetical protein
MGETMSEGDDSGAEQSNVTLPADAFATQPKEGDRITFCVTGADEDGVQGYWMSEDAEESGEDYDKNYWADFKKSMSARNPDKERM